MKVNKIKHNKGDGIIEVFIIVLFCLVSFMFGIGFGVRGLRKQAVDANVAHYIVDPKTGQTTFVFVTNKVDGLKTKD